MKIANIKVDNLPEAATLADWSRALQCSYVTIHRYYKLGAFKGRRQVDRSIIVQKADILKWLRIK